MPEDHSLTVGLEVDGSPLDDTLRPLVYEVVVDDYLHQPDMVTVRFLDFDRSVVSSARIKIGSKLKVTATALGFHQTTTHRQNVNVGGVWNRYAASR